MDEQAATTSQPQFITQQPLPKDSPDPNPQKPTVAATVSC